MKMTQRAFLLLLLGGFALVWTFLMGIGVKPIQSTAGSGPGFSSGNATVAGKGATIKYTDGSHFPAVTVYLAANDQNGQPVLGLRKENFSLTEDGQPVVITGFTAAGSQAATVMLVIDGSGSMADANKIGGAQQAAISFVQHLQPGQDQAGLIVFNNNIAVSQPLGMVSAASQKALIDQINAINPESGTEFYLAVQKAIEQLQSVGGRKVVLALTDGLDNNKEARLEDTIALAKQANVPIYTIGLGGTTDLDEAGMQQLADQSGATYAHSPSAADLEKLYLAIASNLRNEYALTYRSVTPNLDGTRRSLQVSFTTASGQTIQGEAGYGVGGVLASSQNLGLFIPLFAGLLLGLVVLYRWPTWQRRASKEVSPANGTSGADNLTGAPFPPFSSPPLAPAVGRSAAADSVAPTIQIPPVAKLAATSAPSIAPVREQLPAVKPGEHNTPALVLELTLPVAETLIGSGQGCQVALANSTIVTQHARISQVDGRYVVDDLSNGQTQVSFSGDPAQLRTAQRNALRDGTLLQLGQERLVFRQPTGQTPYLERRYPLTPAGLTLGSEATCDVVLAGAAPRQARVTQDGARWVVDELASGAFVSYSGNPAQERPLAGRNALKAGSTVRAGAVTLRLDM